MRYCRWLFLAAGVFGIGCTTAQRRPPIDSWGCQPPAANIYVKHGVDVSVGEANLGTIYYAYVKGLTLNYKPEVVHLVSEGALEADLGQYLRCLAISRDGFTHEQALWMETRFTFMNSRPPPTAEQVLQFLRENPAPNGSVEIPRATIQTQEVSNAGTIEGGVYQIHGTGNSISTK